MFSQADFNQDGSIDQNEFRQWARVQGGGGSGFDASSSVGGYSAQQYGDVSASQQYGGFEDGNLASGNVYGSNYESSQQYQPGGINAGSFSATQSGYESSSSAGGLYSGVGGLSAESKIVDYSSQTAGGLFNDPNPQIIRRAAAGGAVTYKQNILVKFLQPPPVPPPGPLIIKEVRPPQPPPPPPLVIRQRAPPLPSPPPLILRERPPQPPQSIASQTIIRRLNPIPVPPRSVIIERLPPLPPKPRDIIIERWIPYGAQAKRRVVVQRAAAARQYARPRNIIIVYEPIQARVVRQFQRLGVTPENPQAYIARYGAQLQDAHSLLQAARQAGVIEDISPPGGIASASSQFSSGFNTESYNAGFGSDATSLAAGYTSSGYEASSSGITGLQQGDDLSNLQVISGGQGLDLGSIGGQQFAYSGYDSALAGGAGISASSGFESYQQTGTGFDAAQAAFAAADRNRDGAIDQNEFRQFYQQGV
ncbi:unnamed protein product [Didymodactylos carnosus]|uniref:EF-hand domain-containing protein n=1 Tax=Didymodactylos carnosus TaxID=1234261 RepID=A0A813XAL0_9BILA|nr:unnamed protein product [Didymodactylos carnosus]CAF0881376.1 unnamed protein product [Didymodactylos carnosus]CAF3650189.1 unnamed protein product [Didymodactylos carnosus]CAF3665023.1 unnamed protein product [Didymodactylos carnosus]